MTHTFIDLFCGIGGFKIAAERAGFQYVFSSDINPEARETYNTNFGHMPLGDIQEINEDIIQSYEDIDIINAGFPCQPFSISGRQEGFEDENRGNMFFEVIRLARIIQPKVIFLENVAHLVNHDKGQTFEVIIQTLEREGYFVHHSILDASHFGLAQHRKRIYIVAFREDKPFQFPKPTNSFVKLRDILIEGDYNYLEPSEYTLIENPKLSINNMMFVGYLNKNTRKKGIREDATHLSRNHKQINRIYSVEGVHPTIMATEKSGRYYILDDKGVRKLDIRELYRLQGFPNEYKIHETISHAYQQIGNSVPLNVVEAIMLEIRKALLN